MRCFTAILLLAAISGFPSACDTAPEREGFVAIDSAGIRLAVNSASVVNEPLRIDSIPTLTIGAAEGDAAQILYNVTAARLLPDNTMVVVNGGTSELRWYDQAGRLVRTAGGVGAGPGEFSSYGPAGMCVTPPTELLVSDPMQRRAAVFSVSGEFVRTVLLQAESAFPSIQGCFADGSYLGWHSVGPSERVPGTIIESRFVWTRVAGDGSVSATLAEVPGSAQYLLDQGNGAATYHSVPFTVRPSAVAAPASLYVAWGNVPEIQSLGLDGQVDMMIRWAPTSASSEAVYGRYRDHVLAGIEDPERRAGWQRFFDVGIPIPKTLPVVQSLMADELGNIWAEKYRLPWETERRWLVFDPEGRLLSEVTMPAGLRPLHIGQDVVLGVTRDDLDVERIQLHKVVR